MIIVLIYFLAGAILAAGVNIAGLDSMLHFQSYQSLSRLFDPTLVIVVVSALVPIGLALIYKSSLSTNHANNAAFQTKSNQTDFLIIAISALLGFLLASYMLMSM